MAAPHGNKFWQARASHGRQLIFSHPEILRAMCIEYFEWVAENPLLEGKVSNYKGEVSITPLPKMRAMTINALCMFLDISLQAWSEYSQRDGFGEVCAWASNVIRQQKFEGAAADMLNPAIIARDLGLADKREVTGANGQPLTLITHGMTAAEAADAYAATLNNQS